MQVDGYYRGTGLLTKLSLQHIASIRSNLTYLQLQIWNDFDINSLLHCLTCCKKLTTFEIHGKLEGSVKMIPKIITDSLKVIMNVQEVIAH